MCVCVCVYTRASVCTCFCHLGDIHSLLFGHEAQDGEHHEASEEAGAAVNQSQHEGIPATDQSNQLQILVWAHTRAINYRSLYGHTLEQDTKDLR